MSAPAAAMAPGETAGTPDAWSTFRRLLSYARPYWVTGTLATAAAAALSVVVLARPWLMKLLVDDVFGEGNTMLLAPVLIAMVALESVVAGLGYAAEYAYTRMGERAMNLLRREVLHHAHRLPLISLRRYRTGEVVAHFTSDATAIGGVYQRVFSEFSISSLRVLAVVAIIFAVDWRFGLLAAALIPFYAFLPVLMRGKVQGASQRVQDATASLSALLTEFVGGVRDLKAFNREDWAGRRLRTEARRLWRGRLRLVVVRGVAMVQMVAYWGSWGAICLVLARPAVEGQISLGLVMALSFYFLMLEAPSRLIVTSYVEIQTALGAARRVFAFLDIPEEPVGAAAASPPIRDGEVRFDRVAFSFTDDQPVVREVSFRAAPGTTLAVVGPSGAGKTTLINLLLRFVDPASGRITVDGHDTGTLDPAALRGSFGVVFQDPMLFEGAIGENIRFGREDLTDAQVERAAVIANAHDFITATEHGYATRIGERGLRLSGGQAQRVAIARAIAADPRILVLDEATSALDAESERLAQEALARASRGRTTIVIAHRLATVRRADSIVVLDEGRVLDTGLHEELYARCDLYRRLCDLQFLMPDAGTA
ncbi:MAG: ABC transporter ATP-binding protein [Chloroflexi bacterium]|nr:ABC transporter ATP-binding protein [Chloroflexota bacterium]